MLPADPELTDKAGSSPSIQSSSSEHAVSGLWGHRGAQVSSKSDITLFSTADAETKDAKHDYADDNNAGSGINFSLAEDSSTARSVGFATAIVDLEADGGGKDGAAMSPNGANKMGIVMQSQGKEEGGTGVVMDTF